MARSKTPKAPKVMTLAQLETRFPTEVACRDYLMASRWPSGPKCPRCANTKVYGIIAKPHHFQCHECNAKGYRFSVLVGTIFENTNVGLMVWFKVIFLMMSSKKGMSALQIQRMLGIGSYRTAWSMCHRIRSGMADESFQQLTGFVEMDETYIGGKDKNKHWNDSNRSGPGGASRKMIVMGAVQRGGKVIAKAVDKVNSKTVAEFIRAAISHKVSLLSTDSSPAYPAMPHIRRGVVNHNRKQYVVGAIHTNTIEGFWSQFKRGVVGTYHKITPKYIALYVAEFEFRYNNRMNPNIFDAAVAAC